MFSLLDKQINLQHPMSKALILAILLALISICLTQQNLQSHSIQIDVQDLPQLPIYIGSGYNIFYGNPKNQNGLDPGFFNNVFHYTYDHNKTTDDYKFKIPDEIASRKMSTCSFSTEVGSFLGSKSYQVDLKGIVDVTAAGTQANQYAFSMSGSYKKIQNLTKVQKTTFTHASAQCQCYQLLQNKFVTPKLKENFILGVIESTQKNSWVGFIQQFGTHYVHQVIMGGRATQQIQYSYTSYAMMQSVSADINITAKASFAKFLNDTSFDWSKYAKDVSYSESMSEVRKFIYIGGQPSKSGNIMQWQEKVIESPMPIRYKLYNLAELFHQISHKNFDSKKAYSQFTSALQKYRASIGCNKPTQDFPKPPPATVSIVNSTKYGTKDGEKFQSFFNSTTLDMRKLLISNSSTVVTGIQFMLSDGITNLYTAQEGSPVGVVTWDVPGDQTISQIQVRYTDVINSLTFITNKGTKSPKFGGNDGTYALINVPSGYRVLGFFGDKGSVIQKIGFVFGKTIYPSSIESDHSFQDIIFEEI